MEIKKPRLIALVLLLTVLLNSCGSLLPSSDKPDYTGDGPNEEQQALDEERKAEALRTVEALWHYDRAVALERKEEEEQTKEENRPLTVLTTDYTYLVTEAAKDRIREFLADYSSERYQDNMGNRALKTILNGLTGDALNGGIITDRESEKAGFWRVTNCIYYNVFFITDGKDNTARVLFKADMFHYTMKENENLAEAADPRDLTTENAEITEHPNCFLVVAVDSVSQSNISEDMVSPEQVRDTILFFSSYDDAVSSFTDERLKFAEWKVPEGSRIELADGYIGKPIVQMPELVGRYIDISTPDNVKELDDLGIKNYRVEWIDNDGSLVAYSIVSCTKDPGALVDITDTSRDALITVQVAKKAQ